jgi:hypothetical protein
MNYLMIDKTFEKPLSFSPMLAAALGLDEAIVLQLVHYFMVVHLQKERTLHDGRMWVYNSYDEWHARLHFMARSGLVNAIRHLEELGILLAAQLGVNHFDRRKYYTIDYERLREVTGLPHEALFGRAASPAWETLEVDAPEMGEAEVVAATPATPDAPAQTPSEPTMASAPIAQESAASKVEDSTPSNTQDLTVSKVETPDVSNAQKSADEAPGAQASRPEQVASRSADNFAVEAQAATPIEESKAPLYSDSESTDSKSDSSPDSTPDSPADSTGRARAGGAGGEEKAETTDGAPASAAPDPPKDLMDLRRSANRQLVVNGRMQLPEELLDALSAACYPGEDRAKLRAVRGIEVELRRCLFNILRGTPDITVEHFSKFGEFREMMDWTSVTPNEVLQHWNHYLTYYCAPEAYADLLQAAREERRRREARR